MTEHGRHRRIVIRKKASNTHGIPKSYVTGDKGYKLVTEQHFYPPIKESPSKPSKASKPYVQPVKVVGPVRLAAGGRKLRIRRRGKP